VPFAIRLEATVGKGRLLACSYARVVAIAQFDPLAPRNWALEFPETWRRQLEQLVDTWRTFSFVRYTVHISTHQWLSISAVSFAPFSKDACLIAVPRCKTVHGSREFRIAAPTVFNSLPQKIRSCDSISTFRRLLNTFYFSDAFVYPYSDVHPRLRFNLLFC